MIKKTLIVLFLACIFSLGFSPKNRNINHEEQSGFFYAPRNCNNRSVIPQTIPQIGSATSLNPSPDEPENLDALALPESSTLATNTVNPTAEKEMVYDEFDRLIQVKVGDKIYKYAYDYRGRRIVVDETGAGGKYIIITYSGGNAVLESEADSPNAQPKIKRLYHRGPDMGGGVGGINYTTDANGNNPIYYHYNSRGDVVMKTDQNNNVVWAATYEGFGKSTTIINNGDDGARQRSNTKETDPTGFINEGHRYRDPDLGIFLTPDPLEYIDGFNPYIYCSQNPWGKWDPEGLFGDGETYDEYKDRLKEAEKNAKDKPTLFAVAGLLGIKETGRIKGHSNFSGSDKFNFTKEDRDMWTSPFNPFSTDRHFRALEQTEKEIAEAINSLNKDAFERAMHRGQDYFSHYAKGYRWDPQNGEFGHLQDGDAPDKDKRAWSKAEEWTKKWLDKWNKAVSKKDSEQKSKDKEVKKECESNKNSAKQSSNSSTKKPKKEKEEND